VWLTFDDGPDGRGTPGVLDALATAGARATFFLVGEQVAGDPALAAVPRPASAQAPSPEATRAPPTSRGWRSARLPASVLQQPFGETTAREPTAQARNRSAGRQDDTALLERELHLTPGVEPRTLPQLLRDDDLALGAQTMSPPRKYDRSGECYVL